MHRILSNLNRLDVDRLDAADRERVETARDLLEEVSLLTRPGDGSRGGRPGRLLTGGARPRLRRHLSRLFFAPDRGAGATP